ncbi:MAG TPA: hypothetical protein VF043_31680 [Ktedonobacteraceae bacterium]
MSAGKKSDYARFLILMPTGIGDAVAVGLSAVDQIIQMHEFFSTGRANLLTISLRDCNVVE